LNRITQVDYNRVEFVNDPTELELSLNNLIQQVDIQQQSTVRLHVLLDISPKAPITRYHIQVYQVCLES
jgi:hypothetical protein